MSCALYFRTWMGSLAVHVEAVAIDSTGTKGIGACCTSVAASIAYFSILGHRCKLV